MSPIDMEHEPLRLPAWVTALIVTFLPVVIAVLLEQEWRIALAAALTGLIPASGIVAYSESRRARTDSPATVQAQLDAMDAHYLAHTDHAHADEPANIGGIPAPVDEDGVPVEVTYVDPDDETV